MTDTSIPDSLRLSLKRLEEQISLDVQNWREAGRIVTSSEIFIRRPDPSYYYSVEPGMMNEIPPEDLEVEVWDLANLNQFYKTKIESSSAYQRVLDEVVQG